MAVLLLAAAGSFSTASADQTASPAPSEFADSPTTWPALGDAPVSANDVPFATIDTVPTFDLSPLKPASAPAEAPRPEMAVPLNAKVQSFVRLFSGRLKTYLEDGLNRGAQYLPMIQEVFKAEGLPLELAYVPLVESAFKPSVVSKAKAKGLWQFMRGTAIENGLQHDWYIDERADPEKATRAAAKYLKTLYAMFGDWHLALASYNGGPGRVQKAMKRTGKDDFWALAAKGRTLPKETREYVPLILAAVVIARDPAQYGMDIRPLQDLTPQYEQVTLPTAVDLRHIAEWSGTSVQAIQALNPELRRWTTPVRSSEYALKVPVGTAETIGQRLAEFDGHPLAPLDRYTVKKGQTLQTVANQLKVSRVDLAEANYLKTTARLTAGQQLIVPRPPALVTAASRASLPGEESLEGDEGAPETVSTSGRTASTTVVHQVKRGETLGAIASRYRTTVTSVKTWNHLKTTSIRAGQRLTIHLPRTGGTD